MRCVRYPVKTQPPVSTALMPPYGLPSVWTCDTWRERHLVWRQLSFWVRSARRHVSNDKDAQLAAPDASPRIESPATSCAMYAMHRLACVFTADLAPVCGPRRCVRRLFPTWRAASAADFSASCRRKRDGGRPADGGPHSDFSALASGARGRFGDRKGGESAETPVTSDGPRQAQRRLQSRQRLASAAHQPSHARVPGGSACGGRAGRRGPCR